MPGNFTQQHLWRFFVCIGWWTHHVCLFFWFASWLLAEIVAELFGGDSITSDFLSFQIPILFSCPSTQSMSHRWAGCIASYNHIDCPHWHKPCASSFTTFPIDNTFPPSQQQHFKHDVCIVHCHVEEVEHKFWCPFVGLGVPSHVILCFTPFPLSIRWNVLQYVFVCSGQGTGFWLTWAQKFTVTCATIVTL